MFDSIVCFWSVPRLEKSPVPGPPRLVVSTIVLSALLSGVAVHQVHAQNNAPIFNWQGEVQVSPSTLKIREGGTLAYEVRLSEQPAADGWWLRIHVDGVVYYDGRLEEKGIRWVPSVGWQFNREEGKEDSDPTQWRSVWIEALQDDDADDEFVTITHEVWDENSNCPPSLHGVAPVTVRVIDDDVPGIAVSVPRLTVPEGESRPYTVKLNTQPTAATVSVSVSVPSGSDVTVDKPTLTFTPDDWSIPQTVTVTADDDDAADDEVVLRHRGSGGDYSGVQGDSLEVTVDDDDTPGATVSTQSLSVPEGGSKTYTVVLKFQPTATVTVDLTLDPANPDLRVSPSPLTFTRSNWSTAKTVTVRADEDLDSVTDPAVAIKHDFSGGDYGDVTVPDVTATITENDDPGISLSKETLEVREGLSGTYTVKLDTQPVAEVTVAVQGGGDVDVNPSSLTFTRQNWSSRQTVTVDAEHDADTAADLPVTVTHRASGTTGYTGVTAELTVTIDEDDDPGVTVSDPSLTVREGDSNTYTVVLNTQPSTNVEVEVVVPLNTDVSVSPSSRMFTPQNWDMPQDFQVSAAEDNDALPDASVTLTHEASGGEYSNVSVDSVVVRIEENDDPGIAVSVPRLTVPEGESRPYTVKLDTQPMAATVTVSVSVPSGVDVTVDKPQLTFTQDDWSIPQTVTVTADQDDDAADDEVVLRHRGSGGDYSGVQGDSLEVTVDDDDTPGATVSTQSLSVPEGGSKTYTVVLKFQPTAMVTVDLTLDPANPDLRVSPSPLTFTRSTWSTAKTVRVSAAEDTDAATDPPVMLMHDFSGGDYGEVTVADVTVTIIENDQPGVTLSTEVLEVPEAQTRSYTVVLNTPPSTDVTVSVGVPSGAEVNVNPTSLTFTPTDWSSPKTVDVTAVRDNDSDPDPSFLLSHSVTGASEYSGITVDSVRVTIAETDRLTTNDPATGRPTITGTLLVGQTLTAHTTSIEDSDGLTNVRFHYQWVRVEDGAETDIAGANDSTYRLVSADGGNRLQVRVSFTDDEGQAESLTSLPTDTVRRPSPPIPRSPTVSWDAGSYHVLEGETVEVTVRLSSASTRRLTIPLTAKNEDGASDEDYSGVPETVVFDPGDFLATFTFSAVDDGLDEGEETVRLGFGPLSAGVAVGSRATAELTIEDKVLGVGVAPKALEVPEGDSETYTVVLSGQPTGTVTVTVTAAEDDDAVVDAVT